MKVYLEPHTQSRGILRVRDALVRFAPKEVEVVSSENEADLVILHVFGRNTTSLNRAGRLQKEGKHYAVIQYCLRSTMRPHTKDWIDIWKGAHLVWSYYDLPKMLIQDFAPSVINPLVFNFYYEPLGVDPEVFKDSFVQYIPGAGRPYTIVASAQHALSESVRECAYAVQRVNGKLIHIGHDLRRPNTSHYQNVSDEFLADMYSNANFVSGLRRTEGFEFPVIEGALCGARPIVFDRPEMRHWFGQFAIFIPEGSRGEVIDSLEQVFRQGASPVEEWQKALIREKFNWRYIIDGFWRRIL